MTLNKAIEILQDLMTDLPQFSPDDRREAVMLGIEALKQIKESRFDPSTWEPRLLPGETEE